MRLFRHDQLPFFGVFLDFLLKSSDSDQSSMVFSSLRLILTFYFLLNFSCLYKLAHFVYPIFHFATYFVCVSVWVATCPAECRLSGCVCVSQQWNFQLSTNLKKNIKASAFWVTEPTPTNTDVIIWPVWCFLMLRITVVYFLCTDAIMLTSYLEY